jgi:hypothetical protein
MHKSFYRYGLFLLGLVMLFSIASAQIPAAAFNGKPTSGLVPLNVKFTDQSTGSPSGWAWYFGDGSYTAPWTQINASSGWWTRIYHSSVALPDGSIVLMGGAAANDLLGYYMNDVWRSTDDGAT